MADYQRAGPPARALPAIVCERLVGFSHAVRILALANRGTPIFSGLHQFCRKPVSHGLFAAGRGGLDDPAHGEGLTTVGANFDGNLIGGAADPAGFHFDHGLHVVQSLLQNRDGVGPYGAKGGGEGAVNPISPCIANALYQATGVRMRRLPLTPERVWKALQDKRNEKAL